MVPEHRHHQEFPGRLCVRHQLPSKPSPDAVVRWAHGPRNPPRGRRRLDPNSPYVEQNPPNSMRGKGFPAQLNLSPNST